MLRALLKKEMSTSCTSDEDEEFFDNKEIAFETCYGRIDCYAIYDSDCDGLGPFKVCKSPKNVVTGSSCIYRKIKGGNIKHYLDCKFISYL